jgi:hypothetical protein
MELNLHALYTPLWCGALPWEHVCAYCLHERHEVRPLACLTQRFSVTLGHAPGLLKRRISQA